MFKGTITALATPFDDTGVVDFPRLADLVEEQIAAGVDGIVPVGTSGESPTLSMDEHSKVIEFVTKKADHRVKIIAGTGANSTAEAVRLTREAAAIGVDGTLQVTPYYNKPTQEGLYRHFATVADIGVPVVLYNVPGRTGRAIDIQTVSRLYDHGNVVAIKEASGSVERVSAILDACDITVLSGDDMLALPMISVGAQGVISVASHIVPREMSQLVSAALAGDMTTAAAIHKRLYPLFRDLFIETNPIPVKAALAMMGKIKEMYRLPLCEMAPATRAQLESTLRSLGLL